jgi:uncharacterized repeat protein (TIGR01451 family)
MDMHRPRTLAPILLLLMVLTLSFGLAGAAGAQVITYPETPGYPKYGCYDIVTAGIGLWGGESPYQQTVIVPGPVVDAYLYWIGTEDAGAPNAPDQSDLIFNGTTVVGQRIDREVYGTNNPDWFMWRANIGPSGYNLIHQGSNPFIISGWNPSVPFGRNGASVVVVYDTGACPRRTQVDLVDGTDYYWERLSGQQTTDPIIFTFPPAPITQEAIVWLHHAGTDQTNPCRPENIWVARGSGTPPSTIVQYGSPSVGVNGGRLGVANAFVSSTCGTTTTAWPVTGLLGWVDGFGWTTGVGGYISPEWSIIRIKVEIPAGATWLAIQGESVLTGNPTPNQTGESGALFAQLVIPIFVPELRITKTDGLATAKPGDTLTYTINYENYGSAPANDTTIVDTLPPRVSFVSATNGGTYNPATHTVTWNVGTVAQGTGGQVAVTVQLDPVFPAGTTTLENKVAISTTSPGEVDTSDNTATDTTDVFAAVELAISKAAAPEPVDAGGALTYTIDWTVAGNAYAPDVKIVDTLPDLVSFVSASDGGVYDPVAHTVTWNLGQVTPVKTGSYTIQVQVDSPLYNGTTLENTVEIADSIGDSASASITSTVRSDHELAITKVAAPEPVDAGAELTYTIGWEVTGNEPASDAVIVDTLPAEVTFVSASGGGVYDPVAHTVTWNLGEILTPQSGSLEVVVTVNSPQYNGTLLTNSVLFADSDPGTEAAQASVVSTVRSDHTLYIAKSDSPDPVDKGAELTYTIEWRVSGNEPADDIVVSDPLPFGVRFVSASDGGVYDPATNTVTWEVGDKVPGDHGTLTLVVRVNRDFPNGIAIENLVQIADFKPGKEKEATATTQVVQTPEGSIGDTVWYDTNGNGIQEPGEPGIGGVGLILYDAGPDGSCGTADDVPLANAVTNSSGQYRFNEVPAGTYCVDVLDSTLPPGLILTGGSDPHGPIKLAEGQQYRDADFGYGPQPQAGTIGDRVWSDVNGNGVQDAGEVGIGNVTLDLLAAGADGLCGTADDSVVATATTAPDGTYLFTGVPAGTYCVKVTDLNGVLTGMTLTGGTDPHGPITLPAGGTYLNADFGYQGVAYTGQVGDLVFYDANRNGIYEPGPTERGIGDVTINLVAPGADGTLGTADDVVVATATTAADGSYLFTGLPDGNYWVVITDLNGRLLGYTQTFGVPHTNNHGQVSPYPVTISGGNAVLTADFGFADGHLLTVAKVNNIPLGQAVEAGAEMIYTISYSASGREPAINVVLRDLLPMQVDFIAASNGGTYDPVTRLVTWNLGNLNPGDSGSVTLTVRVKKPLPNNSYIFNTVTIIDEARVRDEATDVVRVHAEPILSLTKTNSPTGEVKPGDRIRYTLCYANTGNGNATNVVLRDMIPVFTTYVDGSATGGAVYDAAGRRLTWDLGTIGPDVTGCVSFVVTVDMTIPGVTEVNQGWTVDNIAHLDSLEKPRITATTSNPLNATVKLILSKSATPAGEVKPGDTIEYRLCYANNGTANATGVTLIDVIPVNTTYVAGSATGTVTYNEPTRTLTWNLDTVGPGVSACVTFQVKVNMTITGLTGQATALSFAEWNALSIDNTATLKSDQLPDKTATVSNPLNATVDPAIYKTANMPAVHTGEPVVFTVTVTNRGTANANDVVIIDAIHPRLENVTLVTTKGSASYDAATRVWTVNVGVLAPNETVTIMISGKAARVETKDLPYQITNTAQVRFLEGAPRNSNEVTVDVVYFLPGEIPEANTWLLLGTGLIGLAGYVRLRMARRRRNG